MPLIIEKNYAPCFLVDRQKTDFFLHWVDAYKLFRTSAHVKKS